MTDQQPLRRENMETIDIEKKDGLLEELNVPPAAIKFIRENARNLQIVGAALLAMILAWSAFDYHREVQRESSAFTLHQAMQEVDIAKRAKLLGEVVEKYGRTEAAVLARVELAHIAYDEGRFDEAITGYAEVLNQLSGTNPLRSLVLYSQAQAYEAAGKADEALDSYLRLEKHSGFVLEASLGLGRMYERKGDGENARKTFEKIKGLAATPAPVKEWVAHKLAALPVVTPPQQ